ncbi:Glycosyltransferase involved in cell wall bisynthesis, partial [Desulfonatronum thiosulfatophilum]
GKRLDASGVNVYFMGMRRGVPHPRGIWKLKQLIRKIRPDVIQTWMYHADLLGGLAARMAGKTPVIWNIRHSNLDPKDNKKTTLWTAKVCALLSRRIPRRIVCCSEASRQIHEAIGYDQEKLLVIPNGFDLDAYRPDKEGRRMVNRLIGESVNQSVGGEMGPNTLLIGMMARFDPQKDHRNLVQAAGLLREWGVDCCFVLCGNGVDAKNSQLSGWIRDAGVEDRFFLLGPRDDIPTITTGLDIACLSSVGEGFPNVLGEAMACEVPCVATDVGDCADIVGDTGRIVPPRNPDALAGAIRELVEMGGEGRKQLGRAARERVRERYELGSVVKRYEGLYEDVVGLRD